MKALSQRQITKCETALTARCRCRCRGQLHGVKREGYRQVPMFNIPPDEQHQLPPADFDWSSQRDPW